MMPNISNERAQWTSTRTRIVAGGVIVLIEVKGLSSTPKFPSVYFTYAICFLRLRLRDAPECSHGDVFSSNLCEICNFMC